MTSYKYIKLLPQQQTEGMKVDSMILKEVLESRWMTGKLPASMTKNKGIDNKESLCTAQFYSWKWAVHRSPKCLSSKENFQQSAARLSKQFFVMSFNLLSITNLVRCYTIADGPLRLYISHNFWVVLLEKERVHWEGITHFFLQSFGKMQRRYLTLQKYRKAHFLKREGRAMWVFIKESFSPKSSQMKLTKVLWHSRSEKKNS